MALNMKRFTLPIHLILVNWLLLTLSIPAWSIDKPTIVIFNLLSAPILDQSISGIRSSLAAHGYNDKTATLVEVNANGQFDLLNAYAKEILSKGPSLVIPVSTPVTQAVINEAPSQQQIVFSTVTNPVDVGLNKHPPNVTGVSDVVNYEANIDLIRALIPGVKNVGMIYNPSERNSQFGIDQVQKIIAADGLHLQLIPASNSGEVIEAARNVLTNVDVIYVGSDNTVVSAIDGLLKVANERRIPVIASEVGSVEKGALAAVSVDYVKLGQQVGDIASTILSSQQTAGSIKNVLFLGNMLIINERAADRLGYKIPALFRALSSKIITDKTQ
jgi:putative tryptophan/tyrosine transport system substrate-binding protein